MHAHIGRRVPLNIAVLDPIGEGRGRCAYLRMQPVGRVIALTGPLQGGRVIEAGHGHVELVGIPPTGRVGDPDTDGGWAAPVLGRVDIHVAVAVDGDPRTGVGRVIYGKDEFSVAALNIVGVGPEIDGIVLAGILRRGLIGQAGDRWAMVHADADLIMRRRPPIAGAVHGADVEIVVAVRQPKEALADDVALGAAIRDGGGGLIEHVAETRGAGEIIRPVPGEIGPVTRIADALHRVGG